MANAQTKYILFSPIGQTDPIRDDFDGPFLHIVRHYKPEKAYIFLTAEMVRNLGKPSYYSESLDEPNYYAHYARHIAPNMPVETIETDIENPQDFELIINRFREEIKKIQALYPDHILLLNVSSGTPQMISALCVLKVTVLDGAKAVQVVSPHKRAGSGHKIITKYFEPTQPKEKVLEYWLDENISAHRLLTEGADPSNRCKELDLPGYAGALLKEIVKSQLNEQDYHGAYQTMEGEGNKKFFTEKARIAVKGAFLRSQNMTTEASACFKSAGLPPIGSYMHQKTVEYYLSMKWRFYRREYAVFVLSLTALSDMLYRIVLKQFGFDADKTESGEKNYFSERLLLCNYPDVHALFTTFPRFWNSVSYKKVLEHYDTANKYADAFSWMYDIESEVRHGAAHKGYAVTENDIRAAAGCGIKKVTEKLERFIMQITNVNKSEFCSYERQKETLINLIDSE
jgi:CRISPR type III-A/MTUBE-associated protein Csm6